MRETTAVRCPGLPYPNYTELDKLLEEGWNITRTRCEPADHCVYFTLERESADNDRQRKTDKESDI